MLRLLLCFCSLVLFAPRASAADETVELKNYKPKVGDRVRVTEVVK